MNNIKKFALLGALAFALSGPVMAQAGGMGGGSSGGHGAATAAPTGGGTAASGAMGEKGMHGTTLHKQDKASHARGASAAAAASAMGTNDKGAPQ